MTEAVTDMVDAVISLIRSLAQDGDLPRDLAAASLGAETRLEQLGLDSLGKMHLLSAIDERLHIFIPDDAVHPEMTIGVLANKVASKQRG